MIGVFTCAPSRLTLVSISTMSRSTRGRSLSFRQAVTFSLAVISSSAPVSQNTHDSGRITRRAFCSSASRSTQSLSMHSLFPALPRRAITPLHVSITEMRCPGARRRGRLGVFHCRECSMAVRPPVHRRQAQDLPRAAQVRLLRHSQSVERRQRALSAGPGLQGAGDHQLRPRPFGGLSRRRAVDGRGAGALPRARRGDRHSAQRRFRERLCRRSRRRRRRT